jgi:cell wall-associated NlpC family hydrolase
MQKNPITLLAPLLVFLVISLSACATNAQEKPTVISGPKAELPIPLSNGPAANKSANNKSTDTAGKTISISSLLLNSEARNEVVLRAMSLLGVNYKFGGNTPDSGLDCSGFVRLVFKDALGVILPRRSEEISGAVLEIAPSDLKPGDLVFFNTLQKAFSHVGIYIGNNQFIHAPSSGQTIKVEMLDKQYWVSRFSGARRVGEEAAVK